MTTHITIAKQILAQFGGAVRLMVMIGARDFMANKNSVAFRFDGETKNGANSVQIRLDGSGTYSLIWHHIGRGFTVRSLGETPGVALESIRAAFETATGLSLSG